jgi:hypothetical protein
MPSQKTKGLEVLLQDGVFSEKSWRKFLETRLELVDPFLNRFSLETLGDKKYLGNGNSQSHSLRTDGPKLFLDPKEIKGQNLDLQGIFPNHARLASGKGRENIMMSWGISRKGKWLLIQIQFQKCEISAEKKAAGFSGYEQATAVAIKESTIEDILADSGFSPVEIKRVIESTIWEWIRLHKEVQESIEQLERTLKMEHQVASLKKLDVY